MLRKYLLQLTKHLFAKTIWTKAFISMRPDPVWSFEIDYRYIKMWQSDGKGFRPGESRALSEGAGGPIYICHEEEQCVLSWLSIQWTVFRSKGVQQYYTIERCDFVLYMDSFVLKSYTYLLSSQNMMWPTDFWNLKFI